MKKLLTIILFLALTAPGSAQLQIDKAAQASGIETVLTDHVAAIEAEDIAAWAETMVDDAAAVYFLPDSPAIVGFEALRERMAELFEKLDSVRITVSDLSVHISPHQTRAYATSRWHFTASRDEKQIDRHLRATFVLWKWVQGWRIYHFHLSAAP